LSNLILSNHSKKELNSLGSCGQSYMFGVTQCPGWTSAVLWELLTFRLILYINVLNLFGLIFIFGQFSDGIRHFFLHMFLFLHLCHNRGQRQHYDAPPSPTTFKVGQK